MFSFEILTDTIFPFMGKIFAVLKWFGELNLADFMGQITNVTYAHPAVLTNVFTGERFEFTILRTSELIIENFSNINNMVELVRQTIVNIDPLSFFTNGSPVAPIVPPDSILHGLYEFFVELSSYTLGSAFWLLFVLFATIPSAIISLLTHTTYGIFLGLGNFLDLSLLPAWLFFVVASITFILPLALFKAVRRIFW